MGLPRLPPPPKAPPRIFRAQDICLRKEAFILPQRGFEQNKVDLPRDAASGCAGHALRRL